MLNFYIIEELKIREICMKIQSLLFWFKIGNENKIIVPYQNPKATFLI